MITFTPLPHESESEPAEEETYYIGQRFKEFRTDNIYELVVLNPNESKSTYVTLLSSALKDEIAQGTQALFLISGYLVKNSKAITEQEFRAICQTAKIAFLNPID